MTPPCKEKIRVGDVETTVTCLNPAMSVELRKDPVEGAGSDQVTSMTRDIQSMEFFSQQNLSS